MKEKMDVKEKIRQLGEELIKYDLKSANRYYYLKGVTHEFNRFIILVLGFWIVMNLLPFVAKYIYPSVDNYKVDTLSQCIVGGLFFLLVILEIRARFNVKKQHAEAETMLAKRESIITQLNEYKSHCQSKT